MPNQHRRWVANHLQDKTAELKYFLTHVVEGAADSLRQFQARLVVADPNPANLAVVFGLSAFANSMQALKDAVKTATGEDITWTQIGALRHGEFLREARNASTHDGHPVVTAWIEGHFRVILKIERFHGSRKIVIEAPEADIPTICLEFAVDFTNLLVRRLERHCGRQELLGSRFTEEEYDGWASSPFVPEDVRRMLQERRSECVAQIRANTADPISAAIKELRQVGDWANVMLGAGPQRRARTGQADV